MPDANRAATKITAAPSAHMRGRYRVVHCADGTFLNPSEAVTRAAGNDAGMRSTIWLSAE